MKGRSSQRCKTAAQISPHQCRRRITRQLGVIVSGGDLAQIHSYPAEPVQFLQQRHDRCRSNEVHSRRRRGSLQCSMGSATRTCMEPAAVRAMPRVPSFARADSSTWPGRAVRNSCTCVPATYALSVAPSVDDTLAHAPTRILRGIGNIQAQINSTQAG
jgi:hypothetical protein